MLSPEDRRRLDWILSKAQTAMESLSEWEQNFVNDFTDRLEKWSDRLQVSERQWEVLERIREKAA